MLKKIIVALAATAALGLAHAQAGKFGYGAVSYTHLTLPTILLV